MKSFNWINDDIKIDFSVSELLSNTMAEAEEADLNGNNGEYMVLSDMLDVYAKNAYSCGKITKEQWDRICQRYPYV